MAKNYKAVYQVTKSTNKKGKLKGRNKKETKALKGICPHCRINKKGKRVLTLARYSEDEFTCTMCGGVWPIHILRGKEIDDAVDDMIKVNNQAKLNAVQLGVEEKTVDYLTTMGANLAVYKKIVKRLSKIASKQEDSFSYKNKKKGKNGGNNSALSSSYGSWSTK